MHATIMYKHCLFVAFSLACTLDNSPTSLKFVVAGNMITASTASFMSGTLFMHPERYSAILPVTKAFMIQKSYITFLVKH